MSKTQILLCILIACTLGYIILAWVMPKEWIASLLTSEVWLVQMVTTSLNGFFGVLPEPFSSIGKVAIGGGLGSVGASYLKNKAFTSQIAQVQDQNSTLQTSNATLATTLQTTQQQTNDQITELNQKVTTLNGTVTTLQDQATQAQNSIDQYEALAEKLRAEKNEAYKMVSVIKTPTLEELITKIELSGYKVTKVIE